MSPSISRSISPTPCSIPESVIEAGTDGDRNPPRTVHSRHHAVPAETGIPDVDPDHRGRHRLPRADHPDGDLRAAAGAARPAAADAGAAAETIQRAVPA